jgi:predicted AAA+ superfamily ATPase
VPRRALDEVHAALADTRVVTINGARQVGKSTLAGLVVGSTPGAVLRTLDDPLELAAAQADPVPFIRHDGLLCIDEIQRAPELLLAIKASVDRDPRPGRFLLTGSARVLALADLPDALVGRMQAVELWPLSQGEMTGEGDAFVSAAFQHGAELDVESAVSRDDYAERIVRGGFPEAVRRTDARRRAQFFGAYLNNLLERDIRQLSDVGRLGDLRRLAGAVAARSAGLLVAQALARDVGLAPRTAARYLDLFDLTFLTRRIPAWATNATVRAVATPKLLMTDSGLCAHVLGMSAGRLATPDPAGGPVVETWVLSELGRQLDWNTPEARLYHYRTRDGIEVDAVLEDPRGRVVGIEVKAAEMVRASDFRGLMHLRDRLGERFLAGFVLHLGTASRAFGDRLRALPAAALWAAAAP